MKKKLIIYTSILILAISSFSFIPDYFEISKNLDIFNSVYREVNIAYVDDTKPGQLMKTGIDAMLNALDPYTNYFTENEIEDYRYMTTGEYGGIGAIIGEMENKLIVVDPYEGFAAHKAGIRAGDQVVEVNGINAVGRKYDEITSMLKGQAGTSFKMKVLHPGQTTPVELNLTREEIKNKAVPYSGLLENNTGYIKLVSFTDNCSGEVKDAFLNLKGKGAKQFVLDLRGNLGGLLNEAVNIVNFFVEKGQPIVYTKGKLQDWDKTYLSVNNPIDTQTPLVVLVDENSASASEIVSGALQDLDRAVVLGQRTYGKGLVQQTKDLVYNAKVKITVAKYYIPSGRCVQALDYSTKNEEGRVERVPDSLITAFKTKGGRIVYDGAGVMPDMKLEELQMPDVLAALMGKYLIFNYATEYALKKPSVATGKTFELTESEYNDFVSYTKTKDYSYKTESEQKIIELQKAASEEKYFSDIKNEYDALVQKMNARKKDDLQKYKAEIKQALEEEIVSRYYFQNGRLEYDLMHDTEIKEGIKLLNDVTRLKSVLTTIEKPTKPFNPKKKF
jgi:carboxyl-terminal processing protease